MPRAFLLLFAALLAAVSAVANPTLTVGTVSARPGERASGWIDVPRGIDDGTRIPVTIINGKGDGPAVALLAGVHGYEYAAIIALERLAPQLDAETLKGAVILVHIANPPAFYGRRVYYGADGKNLNRVYPGSPSGTISERIADAITREVIGRSTHLIDMHGGDGNESLRPYTYWMRTGDASLDAASKELALAYGFERIVIDDERPASPQKTLYTEATALSRGVPAITVESGAVGTTDDSVVRPHVDGVLSVLRHLGMLSSGVDRTVSHPLWIRKIEVLRSTKPGVWHPEVVPDQQVAKGMIVGRVLDPFGNILEEIRAPYAGQMIYVVVTPPTSAGEPLGAVVAYLAEGEALPPVRPTRSSAP